MGIRKCSEREGGEERTAGHGRREKRRGEERRGEKRRKGAEKVRLEERRGEKEQRKSD